MHVSCSICSDVFTNGADISAIPCGHLFHSICILQWFENSKTCPQCRVKTTTNKLVKLFFDSSFVDSFDKKDAETLDNLLTNAKHQILLKDQELYNLKNDVSKYKSTNMELIDEVKKYNQKIKSQASKVSDLESQLQVQRHYTKIMKKVESERDQAQAKVRSYEDVKLLMAGNEDEVKRMLESYSSSDSEAARTLANVCTLLKSEIREISIKKSNYFSELKLAKSNFIQKRQQVLDLQKETEYLREKVKCQADDIARLEDYNAKLHKKVESLESAIISPSRDDLASRALHRLLSENLTPVNMKRARPQAEKEDDCCTPEILTKRSKSKLNESLDLFEDDSDSLPNNQKESSLKTKMSSDQKLSLLEVTVQKPPSDSSPYLKVKYNSYIPPQARKKVDGSSKTASFHSKSEDYPKKSGMSYDGLGGHHKADDFPRPSLVTVKKRVSKPMKVSTVNKNSGKSNTITNFFKNTFED